MTDKPAQTVKAKRKKYTRLVDIERPQLNIDRDFENLKVAGAVNPPSFGLDEVAVLLRVIKEKDYQNHNLMETINQNRQIITDLFEDVNYLRDLLYNPNIFLAE